MLVEVCANSLQSALNAQIAGADRIELCSELAVGGVTPSYGLLKAVKAEISLPVHVLIRPRSGDFTFDKHDFEIMKEDILRCVDFGFQGVVTGVLYNDLTLDEERTAQLKEVAGDLKFTFHRAFDWVKDPIKTLKQLESMGVDNILTSGQQTTALEGIALLTDLQKKATRCVIMPGGGVRPDNANIFKKIGCKAIHLSAVKFSKTLLQLPKVSMNSPTFLKNSEIGISDIETIRNVVNEVK